VEKLKSRGDLEDEQKIIEQVLKPANFAREHPLMYQSEFSFVEAFHEFCVLESKSLDCLIDCNAYVDMPF
jgi:hypothetical protein